MARAIEAAPAALQPLIVDALNSNGLIVQLMPDFPSDDGADGPMRDAPRLARLFAQSGADLEGRSFRVPIRAGAVVHSLSGGRLRSEGPVPLRVGLRTPRPLLV